MIVYFFATNKKCWIRVLQRQFRWTLLFETLFTGAKYKYNSELDYAFLCRNEGGRGVGYIFLVDKKLAYFRRRWKGWPRRDWWENI